jgi:hypothetical protein
MDLIDTKNDEFRHQKIIKPITYSLFFLFSSESLSPLSNLGPEKKNKTFEPN